MAININDKYPGQTSGITVGYPYGKARNNLQEDDGTGTPYEQDLINDTVGFHQALLSEVGAVPSGLPDSVGASQYLDAIKRISSYVVRNIAELKSISPAIYPSIMLIDQHREGVFVWRAGDYSAEVASDIYEGVYIGSNTTPSTNGAWVRSQSIFLTPYNFGAIGDGAADDTLALQSWLDSSSTFLYLAKGVYRIVDTKQNGSETLLSSVDNRTIRGEGIITATSNIYRAFKNIGANCEITINVDGNNNICGGIRTDGENSWIHHCRIRDLRSTAAVGFGSTAIEGRLQGKDTGILIENNYIDGVVAEGNGSFGDGNGMSRGVSLSTDQEISEHAIVRNNVINNILGEEGDSIVAIASSNGVYHKWPIHCHNNDIKGWTRRGSKFQCSGARVYHNTYSNIHTSATQAPGLQAVIDFVQGDDHHAVGNTLVGCQFSTQLSAQSGGESLDNILVKDNVITGLSEDSTNSVFYINSNGTNVVVDGNKILCPDYTGNAITVLNTTGGQISNNTVLIDEAGGGVPINNHPSNTDVEEFGNVPDGAVKTRSFSVDTTNRMGGFHNQQAGREPQTALDVVVSYEPRKALRLTDVDTTLTNDQLVHAIEFYQNDDAGPGVSAAVRTKASGTTGLLDLEFYTGADDLRLTLNRSGVLLPAVDDAQDLGSSSAQFKDIFVSQSLLVGGNQVVSTQQPAIPDGSDATVNSILAALRAHGLIAT